jgi:hypothetical protein
MPSIHKLKNRLGCIVTGQYRLKQTLYHKFSGGNPYTVLQLADASGSIRVYCWPESGLLSELPDQPEKVVEVTMYVRVFNDEVVADLRGIRLPGPDKVTNAALLLDRAACPPVAVPALVSLATFVHRLEPEALRGFVNRVLLDERVDHQLLRCKASQRHHHRYRGGLLVHSVQVMDVAQAMAIAGGLTPLETAITQVTALFHDLGKLRSVGPGTTRPVPQHLVRHETQTLRLLAPHLDWLRARAPEIASGIEYSLDYLSQPAAHRGQARFVGAELVASADRMSAALDNGRRLTDLLRGIRLPLTNTTNTHDRAAATAASAH